MKNIVIFTIFAILVSCSLARGKRARHIFDLDVHARSLCARFQSQCDHYANAVFLDANTRRDAILECENTWTGDCFEIVQGVLRCLRYCMGNCKQSTSSSSTTTTNTTSTNKTNTSTTNKTRIAKKRWGAEENTTATWGGKAVNWQGFIDPSAPNMPENSQVNTCLKDCQCLRAKKYNRFRGLLF